MALLKPLKKACRHLFERALGRRGIEGADIHQMDLMGAKRLGAAEDLRHIETRLHMIEHDDEVVRTWLGQQVAVLLLDVAGERLIA